MQCAWFLMLTVRVGLHLDLLLFRVGRPYFAQQYGSVWFFLQQCEHNLLFAFPVSSVLLLNSADASGMQTDVERIADLFSSCKSLLRTSSKVKHGSSSPIASRAVIIVSKRFGRPLSTVLEIDISRYDLRTRVTVSMQLGSFHAHLFCVTWHITLALQLTWQITHDVSNYTSLQLTCRITLHYS